MSEQWESAPRQTGWAAPDAPSASASSAVGVPAVPAGETDQTDQTGQASQTGHAGQPAAGFQSPAAASDPPNGTATGTPVPAFPANEPAYPSPSVYQQHYYPFATTPSGPSAPATTARAAAIIQLGQSVAWLVAGIVLLVLTQKPDSFYAARIDIEDSDLTFDDVRAAMVFLAVVIFMAVVTMTILAIMVLQRINGCRIASAVLQIVFGSFVLIAVAGSLGSGDLPTVLIGVLLVLAGTAATILLFLSPTARYCATRRPSGLRY